MVVGRVGQVLGRLGRRAPEAPAQSSTPADTATTTPAKKAPTKKAPTKKASAKKAPAKKAPAKKAPAKKARAKNAPTKTAAATSAAPATKGTTVTAIAGDWTQDELDEIQATLRLEVDNLRAEYAQSIQDLNTLQQSNNDGSGDDQADAGSKTFDREQELSIAANRADLLAQFERALERLVAGTYGLCESCGKPIPKARLQAFPAATLDIACKQREERR